MGMQSLLLDRLEAAVPGATRTDVDLAQLSRWRIGGRAAAVVEPRDAVEVAGVMSALHGTSIPVLVVGEMSNILFDSRGFDGVVIRIGDAMSNFHVDRRWIRAQAGVAVPKLARVAALRGLSGIEHAVGIPGTLGGLVLMNGGTRRRGIGENVERVVCIDSSGRTVELRQSECGFDYRWSSLQRRNLVVVEVILRLDRGNSQVIQSAVSDILAERAAKFPADHPNCGSTFLSDPAMYASVGPPGRAIEEAGLKGLRVGDAQISTKHANFLLNLGTATSDDVLALIATIRSVVFERSGHLMNCEVKYVAPTGEIRPAHEAADQRWGKVA